MEPLNTFYYMPLYSDLWIQRLIELMRKINSRGISVEGDINNFPNPSSIRAIIEFLVIHQNNCQRSKKEFDIPGYIGLMETLVKALTAQMIKDRFSLRSNIGHTVKEINDIFQKIDWQKGTPEISNMIGKLYLAGSSLVNGLMSDWCTDNGVEAWGPYDASKYFGENSILAIREFPRLKPIELWPETQALPYDHIIIYTVYRAVELEIQFVGCHTIFKGDLRNNLINYAVLANGDLIEDVEKIRKIIGIYLRAAEEQYHRIRRLNFEDLKQKVLEQEHYQFNDLFKFIEEDWHPSREMKDRVHGKKLLKDFYPLSYPNDISLKQISEIFGINSLKKLYLSKRTKVK